VNVQRARDAGAHARDTLGLDTTFAQFQVIGDNTCRSLVALPCDRSNNSEESTTHHATPSAQPHPSYRQPWHPYLNVGLDTLLRQGGVVFAYHVHHSIAHAAKLRVAGAGAELAQRVSGLVIGSVR
jgi:hypothetical protein